MKITETKLKKILNEEIQRVLQATEGPTPEAVLEALDILAEANPSYLKKEVPLLEELVKRIKNSWLFSSFSVL